jgi:hypothetical protein
MCHGFGSMRYIGVLMLGCHFWINVDNSYLIIVFFFSNLDEYIISVDIERT